VTEGEIDQLIQTCPVLYHMAEAGSWGSIREYGLLSTSSLLDLYAITGVERTVIESSNRQSSITIRSANLGPAVIRDQKPMSDSSLRRALGGSMETAEWYRLLNERVFFWLNRDRLLRLLGAAAYREQVHDVIEVDTRALIDAHRSSITLSPINSGCTKPFPHSRGPQTFKSFANYAYEDWVRKRGRREAVVELCVQGAVPKIERYTIRVLCMKGSDKIKEIFPLP
jgi:hypothetical protein